MSDAGVDSSITCLESVYLVGELHGVGLRV